MEERRRQTEELGDCVRMLDVADAAGVSQSTVSRVLGGSPRISEATRERVMEAVQRLGYRLDAGASHLVSRRWKHRGSGGTIAMLRPADDWDKARVSGMKRAVLDRGLRFDPMNLESLTSVPQALRVLRARGIVGVVVTPAHGERRNAVWPELAREFPLVVCNHRTRLRAAPVVVVEAFHRMADAWRSMWAKGYRRIGVAMPAAGPGEVIDYLKGAALRCCEENGVERPSFYAYHEEALPDLQRWIETENLDAILDFESAAWWACHDLGIEIPRQVGYASLRVDGKDGRAGMLENRLEVFECGLDILDFMIRSNRPGSSLSWLLQEIRCQWHDAPTCPGQ